MRGTHESQTGFVARKRGCGFYIQKGNNMKCLKCSGGVLELVGSTDVYTKAGTKAKRSILHMKCLDCSYVSKWRTVWIGRMRMLPYKKGLKYVKHQTG